MYYKIFIGIWSSRVWKKNAFNFCRKKMHFSIPLNKQSLEFKMKLKYNSNASLYGRDKKDIFKKQLTR